jgi:hypothetical protein
MNSLGEPDAARRLPPPCQGVHLCKGGTKLSVEGARHVTGAPRQQ